MLATTFNLNFFSILHPALFFNMGSGDRTQAIRFSQQMLSLLLACHMHLSSVGLVK